MIRNEIAGGDEDAPPAQPCHAEDAAVEGDDGEFDDADAPGVDEDVGKSDLRESGITKSEYCKS